VFAIGRTLAYLLFFRECATPPHVQVRHTMWLSFTRPSPTLVLQATNTGLRRPGYKANTLLHTTIHLTPITCTSSSLAFFCFSHGRYLWTLTTMASSGIGQCSWDWSMEGQSLNKYTIRARNHAYYWGKLEQALHWWTSMHMPCMHHISIYWTLLLYILHIQVV